MTILKRFLRYNDFQNNFLQCFKYPTNQEKATNSVILPFWTWIRLD